MRTSSIALCFFLFLCLAETSAQVRLPRLISDGMVLQRDSRIKVRGWAAPGEQVVLNFHGQTDTVRAGADGKWALELLPLKAGGPFSMEIRATNRIIIKNILIGEVWLCSGQSNMVLPMERVKERYPAIIARAANPDIRQFFVPLHYDFNKPQDELPDGHWTAADPQTVLQFSAAAYFFARALYEKYHVPIGLINASVGGSPVEAWMSEEALTEFPGEMQRVEKFRNARFTDSIREADQRISTDWNELLQKKDSGLQEAIPWFDTAYDASGWKEMIVPGYWDEQGLTLKNGVVWFKKEIRVPASMTGKPAKLLLGRIVDRDFVYVNGRLSGTTGYQYPPRRYELPAGLLRPGRNEIVIRVISNSGRPGFIKDKPYQLTAGGKTIRLAGSWKYKTGAGMPPLPPAVFLQYKPLGLYNGLIAPVTHYTIKGVIWYQGESNTGRAADYRHLFSAMIKDWRKKWNQGDFPFLYVQLPNYGIPSVPLSGKSDWAELREAQLKTLDLPNTAMAVTIDIGEWNDLHPLDKQDVGERLALAARNLAYGEKHLEYSGPLYQSMKVEGKKIILRFTHTGTGLLAKGGELKAFAIAGADHQFLPASAKIVNGKLMVWNNKLAQPRSVRYAWADNPAGANLYNKEGLPASPFRTNE
ncbi:MAG TPA: sialate O-acetylesterase [Puia sp.]|jgi:sialate O-acetylesterase